MNSFLEVVTYEVTAINDFAQLARRAEEVLRRKASGMQWWSHWESVKNPQLKAEVVAWATPAEAYEAARIMEEDPDLKFFTREILAIPHMSHYHAAVTPDDLREQMGNGLLELALFTSEQPAKTQQHQSTLHAAVQNEVGLYHHHSLTDDKRDAAFGDLVLWQSAEAHQSAGAHLTKQPDLAPYFGAIGKLEVFELFTLRYLSGARSQVPGERS